MDDLRYPIGCFAHDGPFTDADLDQWVADIDALHAQWVPLLRSLDRTALARTYVHPEHGKTLPLDWTVGMYAWHGRHHVAHITGLRERNGWNGGI